MPSRIELPFVFLYFRIVVGCALQSPIGWAGLVAMLTHQTWSAGGVFVLAFIAAYAFPNGTLFWRGAIDKRSVQRFLEEHRDARFLRIPSPEFARHFNFDFLIPSYIRPGKLVDYFVQNRLHVFVLKRGKSSPPASARAFVSPVAQDAYIFLRDSPEKLTEGVRYRITHELGHAAGIFQIVAQRNAIGLGSVYFSILWIALTFPWTSLVIGWSLMQAVLAWLFVRPIFVRWRAREHLNGELVADYMALRHVSQAVIERLVDTGKAAALIQEDGKLQPSENAERRAIFAEQIAHLRRGDAIDIPDVYMRETFRHPAILIGFLILHFAYIIMIPALYPPTLTAPIALAIIGLAHFLLAALYDAQLRVDILRTFKAREALSPPSGGQSSEPAAAE
jgi:hypothetical protein